MLWLYKLFWVNVKKKKNRAWRVLNSVIIIINIDFFPGGRGIHYYKKIK